MLDELCDDYEYERKYAIKLLRGGLAPASGRVHPGPERRYGEIQPVVQYIWLAAEQPCGKRLVPILRQWLPYYERRFERLSRGHRQLLAQISAATLDRLLASARAEQVSRGRCGIWRPTAWLIVAGELTQIKDTPGKGRQRGRQTNGRRSRERRAHGHLIGLAGLNGLQRASHRQVSPLHFVRLTGSVHRAW